jgi:hypothetical protein
VEDPAGPDSRRELYVRALALPSTFALAQLVVTTMPFAARIMGMWLHEAGHAVAAWLSGFTAFPGPWMTAVGDERSLTVTMPLVGLLAFGCYHAWQRRRWFWVATAGVMAMLALFCTFALRPFEAQQLITFSGAGGSFVLGTVLMLTMYARRDHPIHEERLRWAFLAIGALAFMDARANWVDTDSIPFGEDERGLSDPSVLMDAYGWTAPQLIARYTQLAGGCVVVLLVGYVAGLIGAYNASESQPERRRVSAAPTWHRER